MPALLASWNPARDAWETSHSHIDLFSGLSAVYSGTWPSSGSMRNGLAYALPTSAPLTDGSACSSSPGQLVPTPLHSDAGPRGGTTGFGLRDWSRELLPTPKTTDAKVPSVGDLNRNEPGLRAIDGLLLRTPTAQLAVNGGSQHPDKRKAGGHGPTLADEVEHLLPTPKATDGTKGGPNQRGSSGDLTLPSAAMTLLPTPRASDGPDASSHGRTWSKTDRSLHTLVHLGELPSIGDRTDLPSDDGNVA